MITKKKSFGIALFAAAVLAVVPATARAQGHFEFSVHYGSWGLNLLKGVIDKATSSAIENLMTDMIEKDHSDVSKNYANATSDFDSGGSNYGFEVRWYPGGENGSFSIGLSVEKTSMRINMKNVQADMSVSYRDFGDPMFKTAQFQGVGSGEFTMHPLSYHFSIRWDIVPSGRIHPYITFGLGIASGRYLDEATLVYSVSGIMTNPDGSTETFPTAGESGSGTKTLKEVRQQADEDAQAQGKSSDIPFWFVPFVQLHVGLKAKITPNIHLLIDGGILDGFILRAGIAVRI